MDAEVQRLWGTGAYFAYGNEWPIGDIELDTMVPGYVQLCNLVSRDPTARMAGFDLTAGRVHQYPDQVVDLVDRVGRAGGYFDAFSVHRVPRLSGGVDAAVAAIDDLADDLLGIGVEVPWWLTELGAGSAELGETGQADFATLVVDHARQVGFEVVLWAMLREVLLNNGYDTFGAYDSSAAQAPKEVAWALAAQF